jgi:NAD(P)-dependent dehydrogenase (short-subunit alcohol dehydrogenase family)
VPINIDLEGRTALVVGGGGGGIGTAMVETLARAGADVGVITYVAEHAEDSRRRIEALGRRCAVAVADVTDEHALVSAIASIADSLGRIRHVVNVIGGALVDDWHRTSDYDLHAFDRIIARNLRYAVVSCREVARPLLAAGEPGSIVNVSSIAARGTPLLAAYGAAKAGLESFSRTMALEWGARGIRVNLVAPGTIKTPRSGQSDLADIAAATIPLARRGEPTDIANTALFLLSDLAAYITGQTIAVDGGSSLGGRGGDRLPDVVTNPVLRERFGD